MIRWITNWFRRSEPLDVYSPRERFIYRYFDGQKEVAADPLRLYRKVMDLWPELSTTMQVAKSASKDAKTAHVDLLARCRDIFGVRELDAGGLTDLEVLDLFDHFMTFATSVKKNTSASPSTSMPTETHGPSSEDGRITRPSSGSGSTEEASSCAGQEASPTEPASH